jgi:hypothetical protein
MATIRGAADDGDDEINSRLRLKTGDGLDEADARHGCGIVWRQPSRRQSR